MSQKIAFSTLRQDISKKCPSFQVSSIFDSNVVTGQSQSGLWFGKTDDLWSFGKPQGWGAVWRRDRVTKGRPSDPFLMTGFDKKVVHFIVHSDKAVHFTIEVDVTGTSGIALFHLSYIFLFCIYIYGYKIHTR